MKYGSFSEGKYKPMDRELTPVEILEIKTRIARMTEDYGGPLPWAVFNPGRHYIDLDMGAMLDGDPKVFIRCKECDHPVHDCTCNQESLSDAELDELLASATTPNLAALYALAKEKR